MVTPCAVIIIGDPILMGSHLHLKFGLVALMTPTVHLLIQELVPLDLVHIITMVLRVVVPSAEVPICSMVGKTPKSILSVSWCSI